jgi:UDP-N-acetylmuramoylalanine--D-glutamate ligase
MKVLIFGLGTLGGGFAAASYFLNRNHEVTVTDLRSEKALGEPLQILKNRGAVAVCEEHRKEDFLKADLVVKNPAIATNNSFLEYAKEVTTDVAYLLSSPLVKTIKIVVVTGTKGKTTTVATVTHILNENNHEALQFGNMGISGFSILSELERREADNIAMPEYLICELSSWQIRDLYTNIKKEIPPFKIVALTSLFADHLNAYSDFQAYKDDKWLLFSSKKTRIIVPDSLIEELGPNKKFKSIESFAGSKNQQLRYMPAWAICKSLGLGSKQISQSLETFRGIPHRQEQLGLHNNIVYINDSSATIPEAVTFSTLNIPWPFHLICGGSDKNLKAEGMLEPLKNALHVHLLEGSFTTDKLIPLLNREKIAYSGPFNSMQKAFENATKMAIESLEIHATVVVLLSPGSASFGLFKHEFDRGDQFRHLYENLENSTNQNS